MDNQEVATTLNTPPVPLLRTIPIETSGVSPSTSKTTTQTTSHALPQRTSQSWQSHLVGYGLSLLLFGSLLGLGLGFDHSSPLTHPKVASSGAVGADPALSGSNLLDGSGLGSSPYSAQSNPFALLPPANSAPGQAGFGKRPANGAAGAQHSPNATPDSPAVTRFNQGVTAQRGGKNNEAVVAYLEALRLNPALTAARVNLSLLYLQMHQPQEALAQLQKAQHSEPKNPAIPWQLAQTLLSLHRNTEAIAPLRDVLHLAPKNRAGYVMMAQVLMSLNRKEEAYGEWVRLATAQPKDPEAAFTAGAIAFEVLKRLPEAERWLREAETASPKDPRVPLLLGRALAMRGKTDAAATVLAHGARQFPDQVEIHTLLSDVRWARGDKDGAISALRSITERVPASAGGGTAQGRLRVALGRLYALRGQWPLAAREWHAATTLMPHDADVHGLLAESLLRSGKPAAGVAQLKQVLQIDPQRQSTRYLLANTLAGLGHLAEAQQEYTTYLKANPHDVRVRAQQATLYERQADIPHAIESWNRVSDILPENPMPPLQRARLLHQSGDDNAALAQYRFTLQVAPNNPQALLGAAQLEEKSGQEMRALTHLRALAVKQPDFAAGYNALLRVSDKTRQLPATLNFLKQQLAKHPDRRLTYDALLQGYQKSGDVDAGRSVVEAFIHRYPKLTAPRIALDAFDLARAKQQLADLRRGKTSGTPTPTTSFPATPAPTAAPTAPSDKMDTNGDKNTQPVPDSAPAPDAPADKSSDD